MSCSMIPKSAYVSVLALKGLTYNEPIPVWLFRRIERAATYFIFKLVPIGTYIPSVDYSSAQMQGIDGSLNVLPAHGSGEQPPCNTRAQNITYLAQLEDV